MKLKRYRYFGELIANSGCFLVSLSFLTVIKASFDTISEVQNMFYSSIKTILNYSKSGESYRFEDPDPLVPFFTQKILNGSLRMLLLARSLLHTSIHG